MSLATLVLLRNLLAVQQINVADPHAVTLAADAARALFELDEAIAAYNSNGQVHHPAKKLSAVQKGK